jgi:hypothetical protein
MPGPPRERWTPSVKGRRHKTWLATIAQKLYNKVIGKGFSSAVCWRRFLTKACTRLKLQSSRECSLELRFSPRLSRLSPSLSSLPLAHTAFLFFPSLRPLAGLSVQDPIGSFEISFTQWPRISIRQLRYGSPNNISMTQTQVPSGSPEVEKHPIYFLALLLQPVFF